MPHRLTVAGEATARSCTSNIIVMACGRILSSYETKWWRGGGWSRRWRRKWEVEEGVEKKR